MPPVLTLVQLWPVFAFFLVLAWIFSLLFLVTSLAGSDFCVDPDQIVEDFLRTDQNQVSAHAMSVFVIQGMVSRKRTPGE